jgi:hypothetical protein
LIEVTFAVAICTILMASLFSAMLLTSRVTAAPYHQGTLDMTALIARWRSDAAVAVSVSQLSATSITFGVPDQNGDGVEETISYDWSAATGGSKTITRAYNGIVESIPVSTATFQVTASVDATVTRDNQESPEQLFLSRVPLLPIAYAIKSTRWTGQFIVPSLPSSATSWRITRARIPMRSKGPVGGQMRVQVRTHASGLPKTIVDETVLHESTLTATFAPREITFPAASNLPLSGACVVLEWVKDADAAEVQYETLTTALLSGHRVTSTNGGASWTGATLQAVGMEVYGTYTVAPDVSVRRLRSLELTFRSDAAMSGNATTTIHFPNTPRVGE